MLDQLYRRSRPSEHSPIDLDDVVAEFFRAGMWHGVNPSRIAWVRARVDGTKPCISPFGFRYVSVVRPDGSGP